MDNTARLNREPWLLLFVEKKDTSNTWVLRRAHSQYTSGYFTASSKCKTEWDSGQRNLVDDQAELSVCECELVSAGRTAFPWSQISTEQWKKPDSGPCRRSIVEERIPRWLYKLKPFKAEQAENQHGLQFVPSAWLVALWNLTRVRGGATQGHSTVRLRWYGKATAPECAYHGSPLIVRLKKTCLTSMDSTV